MKAKHTDHLPFLYTSSAWPIAPSQSKQAGSEPQRPDSFTEILRLYKNNNSVLYLNKILNRASSMSASHVYIEPEEAILRVRYRNLNELSEEIIPTEQADFDAKELLTVLFGDRDEYLSFAEPCILKAHFGAVYYDLKIMPLFTAWGITFTIGMDKSVRLLPMLDELEIPHFALKQLRDILDSKSGFFLLTGPQSSGKQFTRLAMLQDLNTLNRKIISLEPRPQVQIPRISHIPINHDANSSEDFANYILQQAPDICSTDNLVQGETLIPLLNATLNNTTLLASIHAPSAIDALEQLFALGCNQYIIAQSLKGILTQRELPKVCPDCKTVHHLSTTEKKWIEQNFPGNPIVEGSFTLGEGCDKCAKTGLSGSCKVYELIRGSKELSSAIIEGDRCSLTTAISLRSNFQTLKQKAFSLANAGIVPIQQVMLIQ